MGTLLQMPHSNLQILEMEREVNIDFSEDILIIVPVIVITLLVIPINSTIITWITVIKEKTLIDDMIMYDCLANIGFVASLSCRFFQKDDDIFCMAVLVFTYFFVHVNRVIPVSIVIYRYLLVCHLDTAERIGKSRLKKILNLLTLLIPAFLSLLSLIYRNDMIYFLVCKSQEEVFYYDTDDFGVSFSGGFQNNNPIYHPTRIAGLIVCNAYILAVPVGYYKIYTFIEKHNRQMRGESTRQLKF